MTDEGAGSVRGEVDIGGVVDSVRGVFAMGGVVGSTFGTVPAKGWSSSGRGGLYASEAELRDPPASAMLEALRAGEVCGERGSVGVWGKEFGIECPGCWDGGRFGLIISGGEVSVCC